MTKKRHPDDPETARIEARWRTVTERGGWRAETALSAVMARRGAGHEVVCTITADENGRRLFERTFRHPDKGDPAGDPGGQDPAG